MVELDTENYNTFLFIKFKDNFVDFIVEYRNKINK